VLFLFKSCLLAFTCCLQSTKFLPAADGRPSKTKFVPLFSPEGHDRTVAVIPGNYSNGIDLYIYVAIACYIGKIYSTVVVIRFAN